MQWGLQSTGQRRSPYWSGVTLRGVRVPRVHVYLVKNGKLNPPPTQSCSSSQGSPNVSEQRWKVDSFTHQTIRVLYERGAEAFVHREFGLQVHYELH